MAAYASAIRWYQARMRGEQWQPGKCVRCFSNVKYSGIGRIPLYCESVGCLPAQTKAKRARAKGHK